MAQPKRWQQLDKVFLVVIGLCIFFAWMDVKQITTFFVLDLGEAWTLYNTYTGPAIWGMWYMVFLAIGIVWYIVSKDKSESVALVSAGWLLQWFGSQDLAYFFFSPQKMVSEMCWAQGMVPINFISRLLGESCPSGISFTLSGILGVFLAYKAFQYFKVQKW